MWIEFVRDVTVRVTRCTAVAYKAGTTRFVHEKHAAPIIAAGYGRVVESFLMREVSTDATTDCTVIGRSRSASC